MQKLDDGEFAAIILAAAGLKRLAQTQRIQHYFTPAEMLPAVGQGALTIECRIADTEIRERVAALDHLPTRYRVTAERAMNKKLNGNCQVPIAGYATLEGEMITLQGLVGTPDGQQIIKATKTAPQAAATTLGIAVAHDLIAQGAEKILPEFTIYIVRC